MAEKGYIYALINPSLDGLVKIGKTTRETEDRAKELSSSTGVPTPFTVAYEIYVSDCSSAEEYIHTELEIKGYRLSANKEFFNVQLKNLIPIMIEAKSLYSATNKPENEDYQKIEEEPNLLGQQLYEEATKYYNGDGEYLEDKRKALELFKQSAKLGYSYSYYYLSMLYRSGEGCRKDIDKALDYIKKAISFGLDGEYETMANIYIEKKQYENAKKCWDKYCNSNDFKELSAMKKEEKRCQYYDKLNGFDFTDKSKYDRLLKIAVRASDFFSKAKRYEEHGNYKKAIKNYKKSINICPMHDYHNYFFGITYIKLGKLDEALACFQNELQNQPNDVLSYLKMGKIYYEKENYDKAISCYNKAIALSPNTTDCDYYIGLVYDKINDNDKSKKHMIRAAKNGNKKAKNFLSNKNIQNQ